MPFVRSSSSASVGVWAPTSSRDDDLLIEDLGLDSEALLSLVIGLEDRFDVEIPDTDVSLAHLGTISRMVDYLSGAGVS